MPVKITFATNYYLDKTNSKSDVIILPLKKDCFTPLTECGIKLVLQAGEALSNKLMDFNTASDAPKPTAPFGLRDKIKQLVCMPFDVSDEKESATINTRVANFYLKSLEEAVKSKPQQIVVPLVYPRDTPYDAAEAFQTAHKIMQDFAAKNHGTQFIFVMDDAISYQASQRMTETSESKAVSVASHSLFQRRNNALTPLKIDFSVEPETPAALKGKLKQEVQPLFQPKRTVKTKFQESWRTFSTGQLIAAINNNDSTLDSVKFLLGPALYPIDCHYNHGELNKLHWDLYRLHLTKSFFTRAYEGALLYLDYLKHKKVFSLSSFKNSKLAILEKESTAAKKEYGIEFDKGLANYQDHIAKKYKGAFGFEVNKEWDLVHKRKDFLPDHNADLIEKIMVWIQDWNRDAICSQFTTPESRSLNSGLIANNIEAILKILQKEPSLSQLTHHFTHEIRRTQSAIARTESKIKITEHARDSKKLQEIKQYKATATQWLKSDINYKQVINMLSSDLGASYRGLTPVGLIEEIIRFNADTAIHARANDAGNFYDVLAKRLHNKPEFKAELRKHLFDPQFNIVTSLASRVHRYIDNLRQSLTLITNQQEHDDALAIAADTTENADLAIRTLAKEPLNWDEIASLLELLNCKSEAQLSLKAKLVVYVEQAKSSPIGYDLDELLHRRRQILYLVSCLYLASTLMIDEGILFNSSNNNPQPVGIDLIIKCIKKPENSRLAGFLKDFVKEQEANHVCYFEEAPGPFTRTGLTPEIMIAEVTKPVNLIPIQYQKADENNLLQAADDELEQEADYAIMTSSSIKPGQ